MRGDEAIRALPGAYLDALRLAAAGATDEEVAAAVGVSEAAVPVLLHLGATKLESILARRWSPTDPTGATPTAVR